MKMMIVDDHPVLREGLAALLHQALPDMVVIEAGSGPEAIDLMERHGDLDVVVLDLQMPGMNGHEALAEFGRRRPTLPCVVLSSSEEPDDAQRALEAGALAYLPKSAGQKTLIFAIEAVMRGETYLPPLLFSLIGKRQPAPRSEVQPENLRLTERQIAVLRLLSAGHPNKVIATQLGVSEKTVKAHISTIFRALNVINRTQAAAAARRNGLI